MDAMTTKPHTFAAAALLAACAAADASAPSARDAPFRPPPGWVRTAHVHDPSVFRDPDGKFHIVGTHLASARSDNLIRWRQTDTLRNGISPETAEKIRAWNKDDSAKSWFDYLWAPDIVYNRKMRKYCVYLSANGDDWKSNIVLLVADRAEGPYEYAGSVVYGGFSPADWTETDVPAVRIELKPDKTISGAYTGRWDAESGTPYITVTLDGTDVFRGVALTMAVDGTNDKTPAFTAIGDRTQLTLWGSRTTVE